MIQSMLIAMNRFAPLRAAGRLAYQGNARLISQQCRALPEVKAMYLAGSMASGDIAPGLSDIDIVLVIDEIPAEQEYRLIQAIESRLRNLMPPFGRDKSGEHVMIYSVAEWEAIGAVLLGKRSGGARAVFEKWDQFDYRAISPQTQGLHHLLKALWRIETIDIQHTPRSNSRLHNLLELRMAGRLITAIESAVREAGVSEGDAQDVFSQTSQLQKEIGDRQARNDESGLITLLPSLLDSLDRAISHCLPGPGPSVWPGNPIDVAAGPSLELACEWRDALGDLPDGQAIYAARLGKADFLVCDPPDTRMLQLASEARPLRIATSRILDHLYLGADFAPTEFVRLGDLQPFKAEGRLTPERVDLEAYASFPRVRTLVRLDSPGVFNAYARSQAQLLTHFGLTSGELTPVPATTQERFTALRERSRELVRAMNPTAGARTRD